MHRLPSKQAILKFRSAALLLWIAIFLLLASLVTLIYAGLQQSGDLLVIAIVMFVSTGVTALTQLIVASQTKCPLCVTPVLAGKGCSKNRKSKTFLGSYRLRVANNILMHNHFRCPYCSEPTTLEVRTRKHHTLHPGH